MQPIPNPYSGDGTYSTADKVEALRKIINDKEAYHARLVTQRRMRRVNADAQDGVMRDIFNEMEGRLIAEREAAAIIAEQQRELSI